MIENPEQANIYIIGAGVSGLVAALNLQNMGYSPTILEASNSVGGRVQTDTVDGYQLDRGFQVLLDAYPYAKKYLDYDSLELQVLKAGAMIYKNGKASSFGDPLRDPSFLVPTLLSSHATLVDKWKIYQLKTHLLREDIREVFEKESHPTLDYLKVKGFSNNVIEDFFRPFFSGIFLEDRLATSSRMFEFVYKMFATGNATIPKDGMKAIADQLASKLTSTTIQFNQPVRNVSNDLITLKSGETITSDFTIIATDPARLLDNYSSPQQWRKTTTLYFTTPSRTIREPIIGLNANEKRLINHIFYPTSIDTSSFGEDELVSATIVRDHQCSEDELIDKAIKELKEHFGITDIKFLKSYAINHALPIVNDPKDSGNDSETLVMERVALAGDHLLNGSLNAAMSSGEKAAGIANNALTQSALA